MAGALLFMDDELAALLLHAPGSVRPPPARPAEGDGASRTSRRLGDGG